jgi:hypothetical protein
MKAYSRPLLEWEKPKSPSTAVFLNEGFPSGLGNEALTTSWKLQVGHTSSDIVSIVLATACQIRLPLLGLHP